MQIFFSPMSMTPAQCRMARAALRWSLADLAEAASVSVATLNRFERGGDETASVCSLRMVLEDRGCGTRSADAASAKRRGRPQGVARQIADETGLNLRTVQRILSAGRPEKSEAEAEMTLRRFMEAARNFTTFCRENPSGQIGSLAVNELQGEKLREWFGIRRPWLEQLQPEWREDA
jgi:transcriptional regulator with XRE-family HTH domain